MRLIDAESVLNRYQEMCKGIACMDCPFNKDGCAFEKLILESAVVDAEPVVRCKDCIYFHDYGDGVKNCWGDGGGIFTKDDDFCSHAERKDG